MYFVNGHALARNNKLRPNSPHIAEGGAEGKTGKGGRRHGIYNPVRFCATMPARNQRQCLFLISFTAIVYSHVAFIKFVLLVQSTPPNVQCFLSQPLFLHCIFSVDLCLVVKYGDFWF